MKTLTMNTVRVIRQNYIPLIIFWILLFRPQILFWIRHEVINPLQKKYSHSQTDSFYCAKPGHLITPVMNAGIIRTSESEDDGCGGGGSCSDDSDSEDDTEEYYSNDEGCNDDGSCETEEDSYYVEEDNSYRDDGCSCTGETMVTSSGSNSNYYFYSTLQIKLIITGTATSHKLYIADSAGNVMITFFRNASFGNGVYYYDWDGNYGINQFVNVGYYKIVFETEALPYVRHELGFYYSSQHGFEVNSTAGNVAEIYQ